MEIHLTPDKSVALAAQLNMMHLRCILTTPAWSRFQEDSFL
jgi:hypothetical protein